LCVENISISGLFLTSSISDDDDGTFALAVADAVAEHASKSREHWRLELEEEGSDPAKPKAPEESPSKQKSRNKFLRRFFH